MAVNHETSLPWPLARLSQHAQLPLFRNGYALLLSGLTTSGLGLLYWAVAARLYPAATVGLNSALLSAMLLLSGLAQLSLNNVLVRFLPIAGPHSRRLLVYCYSASLVAALGLTLAFLIGLNVWSPALSFLNSSPLWQAAFGLAVMAWSIFALQDSALTGLRKTVWVPLENTLFAILKIILLAVFASIFASAGIFLSWTIPVLLSLIPINLLIAGWLRRQTAPHTEGNAVLSASTLLQYAGGNYLGTIFSLIYTNLLPLLVANNAGAEAAAYFYLPWTISTGLQLIAIHMSTSMTVEAALAPDELAAYARRALGHSFRLLLPLVAVIFVGAPWILSVFGQTYSMEGTPLLRWLSLAALPNLLIVMALALARVQNRAGLIAATQLLVCVLALALTYIFLPRFGITGAGIAWTASQTIGAFVAGLIVLRPHLQPAGAHRATLGERK